jgi:hypothetical protein
MTTIKYGYRDPKEFQAFKVINEGEGKFKILEVKHGYSKSSNKEQFVFTFKLQDAQGNQTLYMNYMQCNEYMAENIWRICEAVGRPDLYSENGTNPEDLKGLAGMCKIRTEPSDDPKYDDKSVIARFIPYKPMLESTLDHPPTNDVEFDDQIPF